MKKNLKKRKKKKKPPKALMQAQSWRGGEAQSSREVRAWQDPAGSTSCRLSLSRSVLNYLPVNQDSFHNTVELGGMKATVAVNWASPPLCVCTCFSCNYDHFFSLILHFTSPSRTKAFSMQRHHLPAAAWCCSEVLGAELHLPAPNEKECSALLVSFC